MSQKIPWMRVLSEGAVIVVSILLAFSIDAWWDGRQQEAERLELLRTMLESVRLNQASITENLNASQINQDRAARFYGLPRSDLTAIATDSAIPMLAGLYQPNTHQASLGPLSQVVYGGELDLIEDPEVLTALDAWLVRTTELEERAGNLADLEIANLTALTSHGFFQQAQLAGREAVPGPVDLRPIRDDPEVMRLGAAVVHQRRVYIGWARQLLDTLDELERLLASEVE